MFTVWRSRRRQVSDLVNVNGWSLIVGGRLREAIAHGNSTVDFIVQSTIPERSFTGENSSKGSGFLFLICFPYKGVDGVVTFDG